MPLLLAPLGVEAVSAHAFGTDSGSAGLHETVGQAKRLVREGDIKVNGELEQRPGRKLVDGDRIALGNQEWVIQP